MVLSTGTALANKAAGGIRDGVCAGERPLKPILLDTCVESDKFASVIEVGGTLVLSCYSEPRCCNSPPVSIAPAGSGPALRPKDADAFRIPCASSPMTNPSAVDA